MKKSFIKKHVSFYKKTLVGTAFATALFFSGCGTDKESQLADDYEKLSSEQPAGSEDVTPSEIPSHVTYHMTLSKGEFVIDADVVADGYATAKVYEQTVTVIDDEYLKNVAAKLFDNGVYEILKPYAVCTQDELETEMEQLETISLSYDFQKEGVGTYWQESLMDLQMAYGRSSNVNILNEKEGQVIYEVESDDGIPAGNSLFLEPVMSLARLRGNIKGMPYELTYTGVGENYRLELESLSGTYALEFYEENFSGSQALYGENECDKEEMRLAVEDVMQKLNIKSVTPVYIYERVCGGSDDSGEMFYGKNGYRYTYVPYRDNMRGIISDYCIGEADTADEWGVARGEGSYQECFVADVEKSGIRRIVFGQLYDDPVCIEQKPNLISVEQAEAVAAEYAEKSCANESGNSIVRIEKIELAYISVQYSNKICMVPAWVFYPETTLMYSSDYPTAYIAVNALDGCAFIGGCNRLYFGNLMYY